MFVIDAEKKGDVKYKKLNMRQIKKASEAPAHLPFKPKPFD